MRKNKLNLSAMQSVISPVNQRSSPLLWGTPRLISWIMGLTGVKNNLVCFPGIIFTMDQCPSPRVQFRDWGWCLQPPLPTQGTEWPHLPLKTIPAWELGLEWGWRDFLPTQGPAAAKLVWWWLLLSGWETEMPEQCCSLGL